MRLLLVALALVVTSPVIAMAQVAKPVEVTNFPAVQDVNVVNAPPAAGSQRFQLVGFTTATLPGNATRFGLTRACQAEFPASRLCNGSEAIETVDIPDGLEGFAWVQIEGRGSGEAFPPRNDCEQWTGTGFLTGATLRADGALFDAFCSIPRPIACCALVP
jgi:hypothetical protein